MAQKSAHEPEADVMNAADVWDDAGRVAAVMLSNLLKAEPLVQMQIPLSVLLSALASLSREELVVLRQRLDERLAA